MTDRKRLAEALEESKDAYGNLERRYATDVLLVPPTIKLDGDRLVWRLQAPAPAWKATHRARRKLPSAAAARAQWKTRRVLPGADMLRAFVKLADAPDRAILAFAKKWGPLGICQHKVPATHSADCDPAGWEESGRVGGWEPLERWRHYAARARAVVIVSHGLRMGARVSVQDIRPVMLDYATQVMVAGRLESKEECPPDLWNTVTSVVNDWLRLGDVRPRLLLTEEIASFDDARRVRPRIVLTPSWRFPSPEFCLFGVLGMQLAFAASSERGLAFCSACGSWFEPVRQLRPDENHYCGGCGRRAMQRAASANYRARLRSKRATAPRRARGSPR